MDFELRRAMKAAAAATTMHTTPIHMGAEAAATRSAPSTSALPMPDTLMTCTNRPAIPRTRPTTSTTGAAILKPPFAASSSAPDSASTSTPRETPPSRLKPSTATGTIGVFQEAMVSIM